MNLNFDQILTTLKASGAAVLGALALFFGLWVKKVYSQKQRNEIDEIDLSAKKISFENHSKPVDDLVSESNKSHGADEMVKDSGVDPKKK